MLKDFGEQGLVSLAESQGVPVLFKSVDVVLSQVRPAYHSQLTEKVQTTVVQPDYYFWPHPTGGTTFRIGLRSFFLELTDFLEGRRLLLLGQVPEDGHVVN
jgi:hypothetical protein